MAWRIATNRLRRVKRVFYRWELSTKGSKETQSASNWSKTPTLRTDSLVRVGKNLGGGRTRKSMMAQPPKFSSNYSTSKPTRRLKNPLSLFIELNLYHTFSWRFCQEQSSTFTYIIDGRDVKVLDRLRGLRYTGGLSISASSSSEFELPLRRAPTSRRNNEGLLF